LDFKALLDKQGVPAEMMRGTVPLDMSQYAKLFTTARYPQQGEDYVRPSCMSPAFLAEALITQ
jgi:hypothetical protein